MRVTCLFFVMGVACLQQQAALLSLAQLGYLIALASLIFFAVRRFIDKTENPYFWRNFNRGLFALVVGFAWASCFAHFYLRTSLPSAYENQDLTIIGTIDSLPLQMAEGQRFNFAVEQILDSRLRADDQAHFPEKLSLSWYLKRQATDDPENPGVRPGERWRFKVRLKRPHGAANPDGFDYEVWLLEQGIRATGTIRDDAGSGAVNQRLDEFVWGIGNLVERGRAILRDRIHVALPGYPYASVIVALVIGDQREIPQSEWTVFNRVGIGHLISISGLHITMVAGLFSGLLAFLWRRSFFLNLSLPLYIPVQKIAALAGAMMAVLYVALAGFGVPAQRTMYMLLVVAVAIWSGRITSFSSVLCLALSLVTLLDPWAVLSPGFWLSFGAVAVIIFAAGGQLHPDSDGRWQKIVRDMRLAGRTQYAVTIGLVPLTMLLFGQISLVGPVANAVAIPLVSFFVTPLALLGSVLPMPLSGLVLKLAHGLIQLLVWFLDYLSASPMAVWSAALPSFSIFLLALVGMLWMLLPRGWPLRWLGAVCCLPLVFQPPLAIANKNLLVTALDVGQGMALLLETAHHRLLYDTGPSYSVDSDSGSRVILPYLKARGINALDMLMISHNDSDHSGGALSILKQLPVSLTSSSLALDSPIVVQSTQHRRCQAGQEWDWDGVHFEILQPVPVSYESIKWKPNARSCTLKVTTDHHSMLLPGDIEAIQEDELINSIPDKLKADVLLAPHHGSGTSSTPAFLHAVSPTLGIFQVCYLNRYHHPKTEVYSRYADFGINRLRTDESGAITLQFSASLQFSQFRQEHARYWYGQ
ncbi:DNA internalization-related competence protein ComEC/Rec2 [Undibacterium sp. Ji67W]|uniref:DNA internalization-related competence protein ComEC/Rec2 n=1 Tax=Undibacterium sp. Ji67W TaxID=3413042 RepID=UPI003BF34602